MLFVTLSESNYSHAIMWLHYDIQLHQQGSDMKEPFPVTHHTQAENIIIAKVKHSKTQIYVSNASVVSPLHLS